MSDIKSLMLWKNDFKNERDWQAICKVLNIPAESVEIELNCTVLVSKENYARGHNEKMAKEL